LLNGDHARKDGGKREEIDKLRIELRATPLEDHATRDLARAPMPVGPAVSDGVEGIDDRNESRRERDSASLQTAGVAASVPALMMRKNAFGQLRI
jgi:hypothetical protein